jgi:DNA invertase Pin-like site-specific DNA recombinase
MATYGYCRVSTTKQADEGESLTVQQRALSGYAMQHGMHLTKVFVERAVSGSTPLAKRPEGGKLLAALQPGDAILVPKLDRMFRSAIDALNVVTDLRDGQIALHMLDLGGDVSSNGISKLVFTILSAVAEAERDRIRERISEVKRDQRARNRHLGGTRPFGFRKVHTPPRGFDLVPVPEEQEAIKHIVQMRSSGDSLRAITATMAAKGFRLSHMGVGKIFRARGLGVWGEQKAAALLERAGFTAIRDLNEDRPHAFGDLFAERAGRRYLISVKTRNKYQEGGSLNTSYNVREKGADVQAIANKYKAELAWVALQVIPERRIFWAYFGTIEQIDRKGERFSIPMRAVDTREYEPLAEGETDDSLQAEWSNGCYPRSREVALRDPPVNEAL